MRKTVRLYQRRYASRNGPARPQSERNSLSEVREVGEPWEERLLIEKLVLSVRSRQRTRTAFLLIRMIIQALQRFAERANPLR